MGSPSSSTVIPTTDIGSRRLAWMSVGVVLRTVGRTLRRAYLQITVRAEVAEFSNRHIPVRHYPASRFECWLCLGWRWLRYLSIYQISEESRPS
jgi:hypothetical protein